MVMLESSKQVFS